MSTARKFRKVICVSGNNIEYGLNLTFLFFTPFVKSIVKPVGSAEVMSR